jgi:hypothetical protein
MSPKPWRKENREVVEREYRAYHEAAQKIREEIEKAEAKKREEGKKEGKK